MPSPEQTAETPPIIAVQTSLTGDEAAPAAAPGNFMLRIDTTAIAAFCVAVWILGSTCMAFWLCAGWARMRRLRSSAAPAEPAAETLCRDIARQMKVASPSVWRSPFLFSPCLDGLRRPAILLPDDVGSNLRETFIHELAHLLRRDGLWNCLRRWTTAALWAQPLLWLLSRRLEATSEEVCDDYVVHWGAKRSAICRPSSRARRKVASARCAGERRDGFVALDAGAGVSSASSTRLGRSRLERGRGPSW